MNKPKVTNTYQFRKILHADNKLVWKFSTVFRGFLAVASLKGKIKEIIVNWIMLHFLKFQNTEQLLSSELSGKQDLLQSYSTRMNNAGDMIDSDAKRQILQHVLV
jgi:hypothetical protein